MSMLKKIDVSFNFKSSADLPEKVTNFVSENSTWMQENLQKEVKKTLEDQKLVET